MLLPGSGCMQGKTLQGMTGPIILQLLVLGGKRDRSHHWKTRSARSSCENHGEYTGNRQVLANRSLLLLLKQEEGRDGE